MLLTGIITPVAAGPSISEISPSSGYCGETVTITITGSGFDLPVFDYTNNVRLYRDSTTANITSLTVSTMTPTKLVAKFSLEPVKTKSVWAVVVVNNDGSEDLYSDAFMVNEVMTLSSISPNYARTNDKRASFTLTGSGLSEVYDVHLYNKGYQNVSAKNVLGDATTISGKFDLTNVPEGLYLVCAGNYYDQKCSPSVTFEVIPDTAGEIEVVSSPAGAEVFVDSTSAGITPCTVKDIIPGYHVIRVTKDGYEIWSKTVKVTDGLTTTVKAELSAITGTVAATVSPQVTVKETLPVAETTVRTPATSAVPAATTTARASPIECVVVLGAIVLGVAVLHRRS